MKFHKILDYVSLAVCGLQIIALNIAYFPLKANDNNTINVIFLLVIPAVTYSISVIWLFSLRSKADKKMKLLTFAGLIVEIACFVLTLLDFGVLTTVIHSLPILLTALLIYWRKYYNYIRNA